MSRVDPTFANAWDRKVREAQEDGTLSGLKFDHVIAHAGTAKWLVARLAARKIPFKIIKLGCGVVRVTSEVDLCPKCHGRGRC